MVKWYNEASFAIKSAVMLCVFGAICLSASAGFTIAYVHSYGEHACSALNLIANTHVATNSPASVIRFHNAIVFWRNSDCLWL